MLPRKAARLHPRPVFRPIPRALGRKARSLAYRRRIGTTLQPALTHHRDGNACRTLQNVDDAVADWRGTIVFREVVKRIEPASFGLDPAGDPMIAGQWKVVDIAHYVPCIIMLFDGSASSSMSHSFPVFPPIKKVNRGGGPDRRKGREPGTPERQSRPAAKRNSSRSGGGRFV